MYVHVSISYHLVSILQLDFICHLTLDLFSKLCNRCIFFGFDFRLVRVCLFWYRLCQTLYFGYSDFGTLLIKKYLLLLFLKYVCMYMYLYLLCYVSMLCDICSLHSIVRVGVRVLQVLFTDVKMISYHFHIRMSLPTFTIF